MTRELPGLGETCEHSGLPCSQLGRRCPLSRCSCWPDKASTKSDPTEAGKMMAGRQGNVGLGKSSRSLPGMGLKKAEGCYSFSQEKVRNDEEQIKNLYCRNLLKIFP